MLQSDHGGRPRQVPPGEYRRARHSHLPVFHKACLDEHGALQGAIAALAPPFAALDLPTADLFAKPVTEAVEREIDRRLADPSITDPMPKVDELEAGRLALQQRRKQARRSIADPMLSRLRLSSWIGERQIQAQIDASPDDAEEIAPGADFVLTMVIFHHDDMSLPVQELRLLGSNTLQEAADRLACFLQTSAPALRDVLPSSYFLIEDQFYDDQREELLSEPILNWVRRERRFAHQNLAPFRRGRSMHRTRLDEIALRPGSIYHYVHLGACRHAIMFTEIAVVGDGDVRKRSAYPLQTALIKERRRHCGICDTKTAVFVTYGDRLAPTNPFFYCDSCYHSMHYSEAGNLLYDGYKVYPYICDLNRP